VVEGQEARERSIFRREEVRGVRRRALFFFTMDAVGVAARRKRVVSMGKSWEETRGERDPGLQDVKAVSREVWGRTRVLVCLRKEEWTELARGLERGADGDI